jgi:hypothetical protein
MIFSGMSESMWEFIALVLAGILIYIIGFFTGAHCGIEMKKDEK